MNYDFVGLDNLGLSLAQSFSLYDDKNIVKDPNTKTVTPSIYDNSCYTTIIYERKVICPVCNTTFITPTLRGTKVRRLESDIDLKPNFNELESICYEVVTCTTCGYSSMMSTFEKLNKLKITDIKENISNHINNNLENIPLNLTIEDAIIKFKLALYCCVHKNSLNSERAFTALKIAWLYRSLKDNENEAYFLNQAYIGFSKAYIEENLPFMNMDYYIATYMVSILALKVGELDVARKYLSTLVIDKNVPPKLKLKIELATQQLRSFK